MLSRVRAKLTVVLSSGVMIAGLALAGAALGAHGMTSPTAAGQFKTKNHSGFAAFTWSEYDGFHGKKRYSVQEIRGTITLSDPDCAADPHGVVTFRA
jgi:hypothetical protein